MSDGVFSFSCGGRRKDCDARSRYGMCPCARFLVSKYQPKQSPQYSKAETGVVLIPIIVPSPRLVSSIVQRESVRANIVLEIAGAWLYI